MQTSTPAPTTTETTTPATIPRSVSALCRKSSSCRANCSPRAATCGTRSSKRLPHCLTAYDRASRPATHRCDADSPPRTTAPFLTTDRHCRFARQLRRPQPRLPRATAESARPRNGRLPLARHTRPNAAPNDINQPRTEHTKLTGWNGHPVKDPGQSQSNRVIKASKVRPPDHHPNMAHDAKPTRTSSAMGSNGSSQPNDSLPASARGRRPNAGAAVTIRHRRSVPAKTIASRARAEQSRQNASRLLLSCLYPWRPFTYGNRAR